MYDAVCLASGGLDSSLCLHLLKQNNISALPVFINYGQLNLDREFSALQRNCRSGKFSQPVYVDLSGFGAVIKTGLTDRSLRVFEDAFTPNRNLLFLTVAGAVAYSRGVTNIVLGLLSERTVIFPDQTDAFLATAREALLSSLGSRMEIHCPLRDMTKADVVCLAREMGIANVYSCHAGTEAPCGKCIACLEYQ